MHEADINKQVPRSDIGVDVGYVVARVASKDAISTAGHSLPP